ncbi:complex III assembly factor LYRM7 [Daktulosphaira vitifoliae]|uniref:complex III assembly factor LYRM7 n=1 Tax=Daktulosphaira vitifoliae TaxID=58002 RepID=UPI0021A9AF6B|nr:complex III assembly factor LYRM7 [Daktulosphaira vitifoliae]
MASNAGKRQVLNAFKLVHKASLKCFKNDNYMQIAAKNQINQEFKKNKCISDPNTVQNLIKFAQDIENELLTQVVQAEQISENKFRLNIDPKRHTHENIPYAELDDKTYKKWKEAKKNDGKKNRKCCCE